MQQHYKWEGTVHFIELFTTPIIKFQSQYHLSEKNLITKQIL
jgi:hypothetical protein